MFQTSLANLWNINNFNTFIAYRNQLNVEFWVGLSQNWGFCSSTNLSNVYEPSFNWTWADGSPLLRDTKGQGLVFFGSREPIGVIPEHYASTGGGFLNDAQCVIGNRAVCSIPRKCLLFGLSHLVSAPANLCADPSGFCTLESEEVVSSNQTYCRTCSPGFFSSIQNSRRICTHCPIGRFAADYGSSSCSSCPKNFYSPNLGSSSCTECPKPTFTRSVGSASLLDCKVQLCSDWRVVSDVNGLHYFADSKNNSKFWNAQDCCQSIKHGAHLPVPKTPEIMNLLANTSSVWMGMYMLTNSGGSIANTTFFWADHSIAYLSRQSHYLSEWM
jgi:hypothetical protein